MQLPKQDLTSFFVTPGQDWSKKAINLALEQKGTNLANVAKELGVTEGTVRNAFYRNTPAYEEAIAQKIGLPPEVIWPSRFRDDSRLSA